MIIQWHLLATSLPKQVAHNIQGKELADGFDNLPNQRIFESTSSLETSVPNHKATSMVGEGTLIALH